jgi:hypothetical protein
MDELPGVARQPKLQVRKSVTVAATQTHAFQVFTRDISKWWPLQTHHIGAVSAKATRIEPRAGGRCYEIGVDGSECDWGTVLVWEPPYRLIIAWQINADWKHDVNVVSEVEVAFIAAGARQTRVELEHRGLESFGARASEMRGVFDSPGGWTGLLAAYGKATEAGA